MAKVLIIVDCQNDFITGSLANEEAQKKVPNIIKKIEDFDGDAIFVTRDTHNEHYLNSKEGKSLPIEHCIEGTWGWDIEEQVKNTLEEARVVRGIPVEYFNKPTFGAYNLTYEVGHTLNLYKDNNVIEIVGFVSSICVISNALLLKTLFYKKADITVDASCIAGLSKDNNKAAIEVMKSCQINVINE